MHEQATLVDIQRERARRERDRVTEQRLVDRASAAEQPGAALPGADLSQAVERIRAGAYEEAQDLLAAQQAEFPDDAALLLMRGEVLLALGRAEEALRRAEADPDNPASHAAQARAKARISAVHNQGLMTG